METDINSIMADVCRTGMMPIASGNALYGDFLTEGDYHSCQNALIRARDDFMALPSRVRRKFDNDPSKLIGFLSDERNREDAIELGLLERPNPPQVATTATPEASNEASKVEPAKADS